MTLPVAAEFYNRTRQSGSIPRSLARQGRLLGLSLYYLLRTSDLAREGFENSGSYKFADHIYRNQPSGRNLFGRWVDARLLAMPAVRSFRSRFLAARDEVASFLCERNGAACNVLSVPCGLPRELVEGASLARERGADLSQAVFHGLDLDTAVQREASIFAAAHGLSNFQTHAGDALDLASYPESVGFVTSTDLAEFLDDEKLLLLYRTIYAVLQPGGRFVSSGMQRRKLSEYLLKLAEIRVHYRNAERLQKLASEAGFRQVAVRYDSFGIQCIMVATK